MPPGHLTHSDRRLGDPEGWVLYLSHSQPERLVVFVHGFGGEAVGTWLRFPEGGQTREWWRASDLLFVAYPSRRDNILGTADRLRSTLPRFFPNLPTEMLQSGDWSVRPHTAINYKSLILVGHSLGGVVVRQALCSAAAEWLERTKATPGIAKPALLTAEVRLFSPASAGFRPAGFLGMIQNTSLWTGVNAYLRRSSAFTDLQPGSQTLKDIRRRTESLVRDHEDDLKALRAHIIWANPDDVVTHGRYDTDHVDNSVDGKSHRKVCKPDANYQLPWDFVETARIS